MCDKLVFDLSQEVEGSPNVFVRKDWINILDNQNQNYSNNQSIIDTSQLSNSNKYMSYREAYLAVPLLLSVGTPTGAQTFTTGAAGVPAASTTVAITPFANAGASDYVVGLKNWFGTIIHSLTMDYNGTTIIQQTPYINMWNSFKLMTSLSLQDLQTQGAQIGFFPDDPDSFQFFPTGFTVAANGTQTASTGSGTEIAATNGGGDYLMQGVCNNTNLDGFTPVANIDNAFNSGAGNNGFLQRQQLINFDTVGPISSGTSFQLGQSSGTYANLLSGITTASSTLNLMWKSYVLKRQSGIATTAIAAPFFTITTAPILQINIMATIKLKHIHSFFNMCPLLKGVFMKLTLNLNNTSSSVINTYTSTGATVPQYSGMYLVSTSNAVGGVNPMLIASPAAIAGATVADNPASATSNGSASAFAKLPFGATTAGGTFRVQTYFNICVGATCLDQTLSGISGIAKGALAQSVYLYIPAYTFNPVFEQAYLSTPIKQIKYTDVYQYQITNITSNGFINNLVTNGIANIKSILVLPFYSALGGSASAANLKSGIVYNNNTHIPQGMPVFQSPYDPAGTGCTSPLCHITNFNIQISGQNAIYNLQKYNFEQFNNQLYGQNSVNGGLTDGLTSGLVGRQEFDMEYCYYYVNVERMLPVEQSVPKSVQIIGQNLSAKACDYYVFVEYGVEISIDALTGARV